MRQGWRGGLVAGRAADLLAVASCGTVADPVRPEEAVPTRFAATAAVSGVGAPARFAELVSRLVEGDPADREYGLTFVAAVDPLTTRLRTLTGAALATFLTAPDDGPGRWVFVTPDHHRWIATRPWAMDAAFIGGTVDTVHALAACHPAVDVTVPARNGRAGTGARRPVRGEVVLDATG